MNSILKTIVIALCTVILEWLFVALVVTFFNGMSTEGAVALGTGFFLAFEMVICTGIIINKLKK